MHTDPPTSRPLPTTTIGGTKVTETRDTVMPIYITEFFTGILRGIGRSYEPTRFCKRVADEVLWDRGILPWRRSPLWLVMRVSLQSVLFTPNSPAETQHQNYKLLMLYIMTRILGIAAGRVGRAHFVPSETLHEMNAKVSRRGAKLSSLELPPTPAFLAEMESVVKETARVLSERWSSAQASYKRQRSWPPTPEINLHTDTNLTMVHSSGYITDVLRCYHYPSEAASPLSNSLSSTKRLEMKGNTNVDISRILNVHLQSCKDQFSLRVFLMDVETWVGEHLNEYVEQHISRVQTCRHLYDFSKFYVNAASKIYKGNPEDISLMILTCMELWVSVDRIATSTCPLLRNYDTEMDATLLSHLLLPTQSLMERCRHLERYIWGRKDNAKFGTAIVDEAHINENTYAVQYFNISSKHQQLRSRIVEQANAEREAKRTEYARVRSQYNQLRLQIAGLSCECEYTGMIGKRIKILTCEQCRLNVQADQMSITVHEWPLPTQENACKTVVFELDIPEDFAAWRDMTYWMMTRVLHHGTRAVSQTPAKAMLDAHQGLKGFFINRGQDITWASTVTSFTTTHYGSRKLVGLATSEMDILLPTALRFRSYHNKTSVWAHDRLSACQSSSSTNVRDRCTFKLQDQYKALQYALNSTEHSPNHTIAHQRDCPREMSLHEYEAFTTLRSGFRLQWWNIMREIKAGTLNVNEVEVHLLFLQAIWQAGPPIPADNSGPMSEADMFARESHLDLLYEQFGIKFISALEGLLRSVEENWLKHVAMRTIVTLSARILSLTPSSTVQVMAVRLLRRCRAVTLEWLRTIQCRIQAAESNNNLHGWQTQALEIAAVCRSTFIVDTKYLNLVFNQECDLADLVECAICVQNYTLPNLHSLHSSLRFLLEKDLRFTHTVQEYLDSIVSRHPRWLDAGILRVWRQYEGDNNGWRKEGAHKGWIRACTKDGRQVSFNLLSGELLVGYRPFGRLPKEYVNHGTYSRIFGNVSTIKRFHFLYEVHC